MNTGRTPLLPIVFLVLAVLACSTTDDKPSIIPGEGTPSATPNCNPKEGDFENRSIGDQQTAVAATKAACATPDFAAATQTAHAATAAAEAINNLATSVAVASMELPATSTPTPTHTPTATTVPGDILLNVLPPTEGVKGVADGTVDCLSLVPAPEAPSIVQPSAAVFSSTREALNVSLTFSGTRDLPADVAAANLLYQVQLAINDPTLAQPPANPDFPLASFQNRIISAQWFSLAGHLGNYETVFQAGQFQNTQNPAGVVAALDAYTATLTIAQASLPAEGTLGVIVSLDNKQCTYLAYSEAGLEVAFEKRADGLIYFSQASQ